MHWASSGTPSGSAYSPSRKSAPGSRDLHDSAGHAISLIAVRAGAARLRHREDPDRSLHALAAIEELARRTVEEIDHTVASLRENNTASVSVEAPRGLASVDTLIAQHAATGLRVTVDARGERRPLSDTTDHAAYRILQEALTNAARHGTGTARIALAFDDTSIDLTVTNPVTTNHAPRTGGDTG